VLSIGEFSIAVRLSVKALRLYHEQGILVPETVDGESGYRYYGWKSMERAAAIKALKEMGFSLSEVGDLLGKNVGEAELSEALSRKLKEIEAGIREQRAAQKKIRDYLKAQTGPEESVHADAPKVVEEEIDGQLVFGIRVRGRYAEIGRIIGLLYAKVGRYAAGGPFCLYYTEEYEEEDADYEVCIPARQRVGIEGVDCREMPGGKAAVIVHRGPYSALHKSYALLFDYARSRKKSIIYPLREAYIKGPGMILRGDPERYRTKLTAMVGS
jgi:DNA-binding transcriptional MerR regulator/effector-binding domain-containing protein